MVHAVSAWDCAPHTEAQLSLSQALCPSQNLQTLRASGASVGCELVLWGGEGERPPLWAARGCLSPGEHRAEAPCVLRMAASLRVGRESQLCAFRARRMRLCRAESGSWAPANHAKAHGMPETTSGDEVLWSQASGVMLEESHEMSLHRLQMLLGIL